jgi:hypothetical protein
LTSLQAQSKQTKVIELRNYLMKPGQRQHFIDTFETRLIDTLNAKKNYILGQYRVKNAPDNFLWIRGFEDMRARAEGYKLFYESKFWQEYRSIPLAYVLNYDNVYLLQPFNITKSEIDSNYSFDTEWFGRHKGIAAVDFYVAKGKRSQLINFIRTTYDSLLHANGIKDVSYWINQTISGGTSDIPTCQDKDLLITISFYRNENDYNAIMKKIDASMSQETKFKMLGIITTKTTWILYPTKKSFSTAKE